MKRGDTFTCHSYYSDPWTITAYVPADYDEVRSLWLLCGLTLMSDDERERLHAIVARDPELFLVARDAAGTPVGAVLGTSDGRRGFVHHLAVRDDLRGHGLGGALLAELEGRFRARGLPRCHLYVAAGNAGVLAFYEKRGWRRRDFTVMSRDLIPADGAPGDDAGSAEGRAAGG